jgi:hypothetical protein
MIFVGWPSIQQLLAVILALGAALLLFVGIVLTIIGSTAGPAPRGRGMIIAGGCTVATAALCVVAAFLLWN